MFHVLFNRATVITSNMRFMVYSRVSDVDFKESLDESVYLADKFI